MIRVIFQKRPTERFSLIGRNEHQDVLSLRLNFIIFSFGKETEFFFPKNRNFQLSPKQKSVSQITTPPKSL